MHVVDISSPRWREQKESVEKILEDMNLADLPVITVLNKTDALSETDIDELLLECDELNGAIKISAKKKQGLGKLQNKIETRVFNR